MNGPDFTTVTPAPDYAGEDDTDRAMIDEMLQMARRFLEDFRWCRAVGEMFVGQAIGGVVGVFLFRIEPAQEDVDEWLWVVVGDIPPAYLVTDDAPTPVDALRSYIELMGEWVDAVKNDRPVDELIPVATADGQYLLETTEETAAMLSSRLEFLAERVVPEFLDVDH